MPDPAIILVRKAGTTLLNQPIPIIIVLTSTVELFKTYRRFQRRPYPPAQQPHPFP